MPTSTPLSLSGVSKRFGDGPEVLSPTDLEAAPGDFISLIGPSGCGKSTLLRLAAGLTSPSAGGVSVGGLAPENAREHMAFIFQEPTLLPWLTVEANVEVPLRIRGVPRDQCRAAAERMLKLVRLEHARHQHPRQLSGGMKMRVSIARALSLAPKLLLLDEPFGALDEMSRDHLNEELLDLRASQAWTAVFVTHSVAEAVFLSNRIVVLAANPGRIFREIRVPFDYPRTEETRRSPAYHALVSEVSAALRSVEQPSHRRP